MPDPTIMGSGAGVVVPADVAQLGYQQLELRKKIALTMMARNKQRGYPKNIGEGLASIGDSMGDIGVMQMLQRQEEERQAELEKRAALAATGGV